jgi:hypothetical protein
VAVVSGVPVPVMDVIGVVVVLDSDVAAVRGVLVFVLLMGLVLAGGAFIDVLPVNPVNVAVVRVVGVVAVLESGMAAAFGVDVRVIGVRVVLAGVRHGGSPSSVTGAPGVVRSGRHGVRPVDPVGH